MTFEERKSEAAVIVADYLDLLTPPRGLTPNQQATKISQISDAFARRMPTDGDFGEKCRMVIQRVTDTHLSNTWPSPAVFVMAMPEERPGGGGRAPDGAAWIGWKENTAERMRAGEPVAEAYIFGIRSKWLLDDGAVDQETMQRYRWGAVSAHRKAYGSSADKMLIARYGDYVRPYLDAAKEVAE